MDIKLYKHYPTHLINSSDWQRRVTTKKIQVNFDIVPPKNKSLGQWQKMKQHIIEQVQKMSIMTTDELYLIKTHIEAGHVPQMFLSIVDEFYQNKKAFTLPIESVSVKGEILYFDYEGGNKLGNKNDTGPKLNPGSLGFRFSTTD